MNFTKEQVLERCILYGYRGSMAHGTYETQKTVPDSIDDVDTIGMMVAPLSCYLGLDQYEQFEKSPTPKDPEDIVIYEIKKYFSLLLKCNPNVLSLLWLEKNHYIKVTPLGQRLIDKRDLFVSKHAYHAFTGYAYGQLKRMTHYKFEGYMGEKRKQLVDRFGYDTKNAAHLIRILKMGIEFLTEGRLYVLRADSQLLMQIKHGEFELEQIKKMSDELFVLAHEAYIKSPLPNEPDKEKVNKLLIQTITDFLYDELYMKV